MNPALTNCLVVVGSVLVTIVWLILLLSSLFFAPKKRVPITTARTAAPDTSDAHPPMRMLERMLIVTSVLMLFATVAFYLGVRSMPN